MHARLGDDGMLNGSAAAQKGAWRSDVRADKWGRGVRCALRRADPDGCVYVASDSAAFKRS